jgi:hypothetical protein
MNAHQRRVARRGDPAGRVDDTRPEGVWDDTLPEGVWDDSAGRLWAECQGCHRDRELDRDWLDTFNLRDFYCGGSPWCIP